MLNLDKVNLQYEDAREMIRNDITVQQLIGMKVHSKAFQTVTPQVIKEKYEEYLADNPPEDEWKYQVLSIRGKEQSVCETLAQKAYEILQQGGHFEDISSDLETPDGVTVSLSDDYSGPSQKISKQHLEAIEPLDVDTISSPVGQLSRFDQSMVYRIFHLKDHTKALPETFDQMHDKIKNEMLFKTADKEKATYINALKKRFGYDTHNPKFELPEDYRPFALI